jgi:predicted transcriptional regulator
MVFELQVKKNTPLTGENDPKIVAETFLKLIGYMSEGEKVTSIPYRLFACFLFHPQKEWMVDELTIELKTTKATVYRHLNKIKALDILEEDKIEEGKKAKKTYRLRYGNLTKAWNFVEAHVKLAMSNYGETVNHLQKLLEER